MDNKYHFIGIGGIGMSGVAKILIDHHYSVSGSDVKETPITTSLRNAGANITIGHHPSNVSSDMTVIYSSGIHNDNPELLRAKDLNLSILHRSEMLKRVMTDKKTLAVTGTHGKTTTSALLTSLLIDSEMNPSYAVGGLLKRNANNAEKNEGAYFVVEADESDGTFVKYDSYGAIITNIGRDHINYFGSMESLVGAFKTFSSKVISKDHLFWCGDNFYLKELMLPGISFGFCEDCDMRVSNYVQNGWTCQFDITYQKNHYKNIKVNLIGAHNALNAAAVFGMALTLGVQEDLIRKGLANFEGVNRRLEKVGSRESTLVIDDYAHHPTEISATLYALKQAEESKKLLVVYQPHRKERIIECLGTFGGIFDAADEVIITDLYEPSPYDKSDLDLAMQIIEEHVQTTPQIPMRYIPKDQIVAHLEKEAFDDTVLAFIGAGDITNVASEVAKHIDCVQLSSK